MNLRVGVLCSALTLFASQPSPAKSISTEKPVWDLNDVSILFALPAPSERETLLLKPESTGKKGALLPSEVYALNSHLMPEDYDKLDSYRRLQAIGMRIDPCFHSNEASTRCEKQIRIVWQPVILDTDSKHTTTGDAAIHTFYELSDTEWTELLGELKELKATHKISTSHLPLGVHPALSNEKTKSAYQAKLNSLIHTYCGVNNLTRFTFMRLQTQGFWWVFGGFDRVGSSWVKMKIPRVQSLADDPVQNFFNEEMPQTPSGLRGAIVFSTKNKEESLDDVVNGFHTPDPSKAWQYDQDKKTFQSKLELISRIENPKVSNPNNMDCVHCHIAQLTKAYLNRSITDLKPPRSFIQQMAIEGRYNIQNISRNSDNTRALRSFGYFGSAPHVNDRVINESVDVAEQLNSVQFR